MFAFSSPTYFAQESSQELFAQIIITNGVTLGTDVTLQVFADVLSGPSNQFTASTRKLLLLLLLFVGFACCFPVYCTYIHSSIS